VTKFDAFASLIRDKRKFIETLLVVEDKKRNRIPFILNPIQADMEATETGRDVYVKPAQVGWSSERLASRLIDTITTPGTNTILIAYEEHITQRLLDKAQFFYRILDSLGIPGFPTLHHDSSYEKTFPSIHSSMYISSARSYVAGRAETIHHLICDEYAFWEPGATERILAPALDRVPMPPFGTIDIGSTPNGEDNPFHDVYIIAKEGKAYGKSTFTAHFYPWFMHPEYKLDKDSIIALPGDREAVLDLNLDEQHLVDNYHLTYDQIRWRRYKIVEMESLRRNGEIRRMFAQEYPEDDVSCFLATGDSFYDVELLNEKGRNCYPASGHHNHAEVWYPPQDGKEYLISIDPGQAKVSQTVMVVLAFEDNVPKYCARAAGLWTLEITADMAKELARYYNNAVITWEANSHGLGLAPLLREYPNLYYRKDVVSGKQSSELGWYTSGGRTGTKDFMLNTMMRMLPKMIVHDIEFISQCRNIRQAGDRVVAVGMDDIHDAVAVGLVCRDSRPVVRGFVGSSGYKW